MSFAAKFAGCCNAGESCQYPGGFISPGDEVRYVDDELMHDSCASVAQRRNVLPLCGDCGTYHNGKC